MVQADGDPYVHVTLQPSYWHCDGSQPCGEASGGEPLLRTCHTVVATVNATTVENGSNAFLCFLHFGLIFIIIQVRLILSKLLVIKLITTNNIIASKKLEKSKMLTPR